MKRLAILLSILALVPDAAWASQQGIVVTKNCSVASFVVSFTIETVIVSVCDAAADGPNVRVLVAETKSGVPGPPATDFAVPSAVA